MNVRISEQAERIIRAQVVGGRYASGEEVVEDVLLRLGAPKPDGPPAVGEKPDRPLNEDEFDRWLIELGMMTELPNPEADRDDPDDEPIEIEGEPMSQTVIRGRR